jgi:hypothetical protein
MPAVRRKIVDLADARRSHESLPSLPACVVGRIVAIDGDGRVSVDFPGNPHGPSTARIIRGTAHRPVEGERVALVFEGGDARLPIVLGCPSDSIDEDLALDVDRLRLSAARELTLRCGAGTIIIGADGSIVIRGSTLLSRAAGVNKIRGAAVKIN